MATGQVAVITGAGSGIGAATARLLARHDATGPPRRYQRRGGGSGGSRNRQSRNGSHRRRHPA